MIQDMAKDGATTDQICASTGMNHNRLRKLMQLTLLTPQLMKAAEVGEINDKVAGRVAKLPVDEQKAALELFTEHGKLSSADVASLRRVGAHEQMEAIPDSAFGEAPPDDWRNKVHALLAQAASLVPVGEVRQVLLDLSKKYS